MKEYPRSNQCFLTVLGIALTTGGAGISMADGGGTGKVGSDGLVLNLRAIGSENSEPIFGTAGDDNYINGTREEGATSVNYDGLGGNDTIYGDYQRFTADEFAANGFFDDTLYGSAGDDLVYGETGGVVLGGFFTALSASIAGGDNRIFGGDGADSLYGGGDRLFVGAESYETDYIIELLPGNDAISGEAGADFIVGDYNDVDMLPRETSSVEGRTSEARFVGGRDYIEGGESDDTIYGEGETLEAYSDSSFATTEFESLPQQPLTFNYATIEAGDDSIKGGPGDDVMSGDGRVLLAEADYQARGEEGAGTSVHLITTGHDDLRGNKGKDTIFGDGVSGTARNLNDPQVQLFAESNSDDSFIYAGSDTIYGGGAADTLIGDISAATAEVTADDDSATVVSGGGDTIFGGKGDDRIYGDFVDVEVSLGNEASSAVVTAGDDRIDGGPGNDELWGDAVTAQVAGGSYVTGKDTFVFQPGSGQDTINDFESGQDLIDLSAFVVSGIEGLSIEGNGDGVVVSFPESGSGEEITVKIVTVGGQSGKGEAQSLAGEGQNGADLTAEDFVFQ